MVDRRARPLGHAASADYHHHDSAANHDDHCPPLQVPRLPLQVLLAALPDHGDTDLRCSQVLRRAAAVPRAPCTASKGPGRVPRVPPRAGANPAPLERQFPAWLAHARAFGRALGGWQGVAPVERASLPGGLSRRHRLGTAYTLDREAPGPPPRGFSLVGFPC